MAAKVFLSYAHEDEQLKMELEKHLSLLKRQGLIDVWHDRDISAGTGWKQEISKQLNEAAIILLLISPDFIASDYCYSIEMQRALERYEKGEATTIPIILRPCDWKSAPFSTLQALPKDTKAVTEWSSWDKAFEDITRGIRSLVEGLTDASDKNMSENLAEQLPRQKKPKRTIKSSSDLSGHIFNPWGMFDNLNEFFGRNNEYNKLLARIRERSSMLVTGPSTIGKTWLLEYLFQAAPTLLDEHFRFVHLNASRPSCDTVNGFVKQILRLTGFPTSEENPVSLGKLEQLVNVLKDGGQNLVLIIDEINGLGTGFNVMAFRQLRAILQSGLVMVGACHLPHKDLIKGDMGRSLFLNTFEPLTLSGFSMSEAKEFVETKGIQAQFTISEQKLMLETGYIYDYNGKKTWPPMRLQEIGQLILDREPGRSLKDYIFETLDRRYEVWRADNFRRHGFDISRKSYNRRK